MWNVSQSILARCEERETRGRANFATSGVNGVHLYLLGEQQRTEDYTNCSPWWFDEVGGEALGTRSRGASSRAAGGHRGRDFAPAKPGDEQSRARARIQVATPIYYSKI